MADRNAGRLVSLDGLRGIAVLAVVATHGGLLPFGNLGVDVFFAISGYLIATILLKEHRRTNHIDLRGFYVRRFRRLLPALWLLVPGALALAFLGHFPVARTVKSALFALTYTSNVLWVFARNGAVEHTWSLAVEEQFYLVFPFVLLVLLRRHPTGDHARGVLLAALALTVARAALYLVWGGDDDVDVWLYTTRFEPILYGVALAFLLDDRNAARAAKRDRVLARVCDPRVTCAAVIAMVAFQVTAIGVDDTHTPGRLYLGGFAFAAVCTVAVVARLVVDPHTTWQRVFSFAPLAYIGRISYGVYLYHYPLWPILRRHTGHNAWLLTSLLAALGIGLAALSYELVEKRFLRPTGTAIGATPGTGDDAGLSNVGSFTRATSLSR